MNIQTHQLIDADLCGRPVRLEDGFSLVSLLTTPRMSVDALGLVHGGFIFGLADYAAMIAVNHPHVVLGAADVKFIKPVRVGETILAEARQTRAEGKKRFVSVQIMRDEEKVFEGAFVCFVLKQGP
jgi:uncharacterized protein (TIGR00369 family)